MDSISCRKFSNKSGRRNILGSTVTLLSFSILQRFMLFTMSSQKSGFFSIAIEGLRCCCCGCFDFAEPVNANKERRNKSKSPCCRHTYARSSSLLFALHHLAASKGNAAFRVSHFAPPVRTYSIFYTYDDLHPSTYQKPHISDRNNRVYLVLDMARLYWKSIE